jgi:hypothetical protein
VHGGGIADDLKREQLDRAPDIVSAHAVLIPLDRRKYQVIDRSDLGEHASDFFGLCQVERKTGMSIADLRSGGFCACLIASSDDHRLAAFRQSVRDLAADSGGSTDDQGADLIGHAKLPPRRG